MPDDTFATTFERLREARGWSPAEVARRLGVYPTEVSRWRHGRGGISIRNVRKIADLFGVDRAELEQLAGYGVSHVDDTGDTLEVERSMWHAVYDDLIEKEVPRSMWQTYIEACQALARAFKTIVPDAFSAPEHSSLNANSVNSAPPDDDPDQSPNSKTSRRLPVLTFCEATV